MIFPRHLALVTALAVAAPAVASAQFGPWGARGTQSQPGYNEGRVRGERAGALDARRGDRFGFTDEADYRAADVGYRSQFGTRDRYRSVFRQGFESGYRAGYAEWSRPGRGRGNAPGSVFGSGPGVGIGRGIGRGTLRNDVATHTGFGDGYSAGLDDGRDGRRFDPISESRYRSADHEYDRSYGPKPVYQNNYRVAFRQGYAEGFEAGSRYR